MLGQHDIEDEGQLRMDKNMTAEYDLVSVPPTAHGSQLEVGVVDAINKEDSEEMEGRQSEMYQNRSDAEMEINSSIEHKEAIE